MKKKCRKCKKELTLLEFPEMNIWKYWVWSTCIRCLAENIKPYELKRSYLKPSTTKINSVSKTNKNNIAEFSKKTKDEIHERQNWKCIITWKSISKDWYHHAFYWPHQANYWPNRNNADQWVWLNTEPHRIIHHPSPKETKLSKIYRWKCIIYLKEIIKKL